MTKKRRDLLLINRYRSPRIDGYANLLVEYIPQQVKHIIRAQILKSSYTIEPKVKEVIKNTRGFLFIDIGANVGMHSLIARNNFKRIIAFEPHPENFNQLKKHTEYFFNIEPKPIAISNYTGTVNLYIAPYSGWHTLKNSKNAQKIQVESDKLSNLLINETKVDLVKVDVEGVEWDVIAGAKDVMPIIKAWIIELHDPERKLELDQLLRNFGYSTIWIDSNHVHARKIN